MNNYSKIKIKNVQLNNVILTDREANLYKYNQDFSQLLEEQGMMLALHGLVAVYCGDFVDYDIECVKDMILKNVIKQSLSLKKTEHNAIKRALNHNKTALILCNYDIYHAHAYNPVTRQVYTIEGLKKYKKSYEIVDDNGKYLDPNSFMIFMDNFICSLPEILFNEIAYEIRLPEDPWYYRPVLRLDLSKISDVTARYVVESLLIKINASRTDIEADSRLFANGLKRYYIERNLLQLSVILDENFENEELRKIADGIIDKLSKL